MCNQHQQTSPFHPSKPLVLRPEIQDLEPSTNAPSVKRRKLAEESEKPGGLKKLRQVIQRDLFGMGKHP